MQDEKDYDDEDVLAKALERFDIAEAYYSELYLEGEEDYDFTLGINQWDDRDKRKRDTQGIPSLVLNQLAPYANQVVNNIRQARPAIRVTPADSDADGETAEVFTGLIRNIERKSKANDAYDMAAANGVMAGLGWIRVSLDYANEFSFDQEISIDRILNFQSAYLDPNSMRLDGSDAEYCFIFDDIPTDQFKESYPDVDTTGWQNAEGWQNEDTIRVAEHYCKKRVKKKIYAVKYMEQNVNELRERVAVREFEGVVTEEEMKALEEEGIELEIIDERETEFVKIMQYTMTGGEILSSTEWPSKYLPLVPVYGLETYIEGKRGFQSLIRQAKDAQRMYNYAKSQQLNIVAMQPKAPYIGPVGAFKSNPQKWADANNENFAFLEYDVVTDDNGNPLPAPVRQPPPQGSQALVQEAETARMDIRFALGMNRANMGEEDNAISGVAIRNRQLEGDNATFHFMDNLATAITQVGCILVDLIPKVYTKPQMARILGADGQEEMVPLNSPFVTNENGQKEQTMNAEYEGIYDLKQGKYDVVVDVGPSYSSQRQEMADKMLELMRIRPDSAAVIGDLFVQSLDMPMAKEVADRIKATMDPAILGDDPEAARLQAAAAEIKTLQEQLQALDAQLQAKQENAQFEQQVKLEELRMEKTRLETEAAKAQADIEKMRSEAIENTAQAQKERTEAALNVQALGEQVADIAAALESTLDIIELERGTTEPEKEVEIDVTVEKENENE